MPSTLPAPVSFRCKKCGRWHTSADAGEMQRPTRCRVCDTNQYANWEVLSEASPARLAELGITAEDVVVHTPARKEDGLRAGISVCKEGLAFLEKKRTHWQENKDKIAAEFAEIDSKLSGLEDKIEALDASDMSALNAMTEEAGKLSQRLRELQNLEPTARDGKREAHLKAKMGEHEAELAGTGTARAPQTVMVRARDGVKTREGSKAQKPA